MRWIERKPNWLGNADKSHRKKKDLNDYGVIYIPLKCPRCGSKNVKCYATYLPTRYHLCKSCGYKFKSIEADE